MNKDSKKHISNTYTLFNPDFPVQAFLKPINVVYVTHTPAYAFTLSFCSVYIQTTLPPHQALSMA